MLRTWEEAGAAIVELQRAGLPLHETPQKNFDHFVLRQALAGVDRRAAIVDLGCGRGHTLAFLHAQGFANLCGVDLVVDRRARARQALLMARGRSACPPFRLYRGDLTRTPFETGSFDVALSISTIEHGVDVEAFLAEAARLLRSGGRLFITTDYWEEKIETDGIRAFGLPWRIFSRDEIGALLAVAGRLGLSMAAPDPIPACVDKPVFWQGRCYTFLAMLLTK